MMLEPLDIYCFIKTGIGSSQSPNFVVNVRLMKPLGCKPISYHVLDHNYMFQLRGFLLLILLVYYKFKA